jgi:hypothetical protein
MKEYELGEIGVCDACFCLFICILYLPSALFAWLRF